MVNKENEYKGKGVSPTFSVPASCVSDDTTGKGVRGLGSYSLSLFSNSSPSNSLSLCRERVRVRDICAAQLPGAPHILAARELGKVPHPPLEDERRPLPTQGEAILREEIQQKAIRKTRVGAALLFFLLSLPLCACAPVAPPAPRPVMVEVPIAIPIYCQVPKLQPPILAIAALTLDSPPADTVRSYAASVDILKSAVHERDTILEACAPPADASTPPIANPQTSKAASPPEPQALSKDDTKADSESIPSRILSTFCKIVTWPQYLFPTEKQIK
jgi:hypothetical protein